jgi:hypothetical protein
MKTQFETEVDRKIASYYDAASQGLAIKDLNAIVKASSEGQVSVLFVNKELQVWGKVSEENQRIYRYKTPGPWREDLLNLAAIHTLVNGGVVYDLLEDKIPENTSIAAILRY